MLASETGESVGVTGVAVNAGGGSVAGDAVGVSAEQASATAIRVRSPGMHSHRRAECNREDGIIPVNRPLRDGKGHTL